MWLKHAGAGRFLSAIYLTFQYELDQQKLTNVLKVDLKTDVMFYLYAKFAHTPFLALIKYTESV